MKICCARGTSIAFLFRISILSLRKTLTSCVCVAIIESAVRCERKNAAMEVEFDGCRQGYGMRRAQIINWALIPAK